MIRANMIADGKCPNCGQSMLLKPAAVVSPDPDKERDKELLRRGAEVLKSLKEPPTITRSATRRIVRYKPHEGESTAIGEHPRGEYVRYADHIAALKACRFTAKERDALREAIHFRLAGEYDDDVDANALRRAEKKL